MILEDVSLEPYGLRLGLVLEQAHGKDFKPRMLTMMDLTCAQSTVNAEMLDEIHCMLRHLCGIKDDK